MSGRSISIGQRSVLLEVDGMKCGACVSAVEQTLRQQVGVVNASVNLVARTAWVSLQDDSASVDPIL